MKATRNPSNIPLTTALLAALVGALSLSSTPVHAGLLGGGAGSAGSRGAAIGGAIAGNAGASINGSMAGLQRPDAGRARDALGQGRDKLSETKSGATDKLEQGKSTAQAAAPTAPDTTAPSGKAEASGQASAHREGSSVGGNAALSGSGSR
ncbi:hypothetical protein [Roseateles violae]|uniref:Uncharacterized protein n=1 Tax=Roseateles violae TaxID=3058042 RepID=A0ABT8DYX1_9BURK|nr:hypothetical protein [Pelomonas sp. PFR6]MDN3922787.1 hypothetical protein [Pelomonas sp. PFR6]